MSPLEMYLSSGDALRTLGRMVGHDEDMLLLCTVQLHMSFIRCAFLLKRFFLV